MKEEPVYRSEHRPLHIIILSISVAIAVGCGFLLFYNTLGAQAPPEFITLKEANEVSFKAYLTDTTPFGRPYLDKTSDAIPMNILDYIDLTTDYQATLTSKSNIDFHDSTTVTVTAAQNKGVSGVENNPVILERTFPLCFNNQNMQNPEVCSDGSGTSTAESISGSDYIFQRTHRLYLKPYIQFVRSTTASYVDYPIKSSITIDFQMSATNNDQLRSLMKRTVTIPLAEDNTKIDIIGEQQQSKDFYAPERSQADIILLICLGVLTIAGLGIAMWMVKKLANKKSPYRLEIDSYLNDYADAIVKTVTPPELKSHPERIAVESLKELLGLAVSISDPIMFFETSTLSLFYITRDKIIYYFIIPNPRFYRGNNSVGTIEAAISPRPKKRLGRSTKTSI